MTAPPLLAREGVRPSGFASRWPSCACAALVALHHVRSLLGSLTPAGGLPRELTTLVAGRVPWGYGFDRAGALFQWGALLLSAGAAVAFVFDRGARVGAALLLAVSLELYWANYPLARFDDYVVNWASLLLCAAPTSQRGAAAYGSAVLGATTWLHLALAFNLVVPSTSLPLRAALCATCALPWVRARSVRVLLGALTAVAYGALAVRGRCWLAIALMTCFQIAGSSAIRASTTPRRLSDESVGAGTLGILAVLVLVLAHGVALTTHLSGLAWRTGRAVAILGLSWPGAYLFHSFAPSALTVRWRAATGGHGERSVSAAAEETLGFALRASFTGAERLRQFGAEHFSDAACRQIAQGPGELTVEQRGVALASVWFDCARSRVVSAVPLTLGR